MGDPELMEGCFGEWVEAEWGDSLEEVVERNDIAEDSLIEQAWQRHGAGRHIVPEERMVQAGHDRRMAARVKMMAVGGRTDLAEKAQGVQSTARQRSCRVKAVAERRLQELDRKAVEGKPREEGCLPAQLQEVGNSTGIGAESLCRPVC